MVARIFLCHAKEDKTQVREVYQRLLAMAGFEPFRRYQYANLFDPRGFDRIVRAIQTEIARRPGAEPMPSREPPQWTNSIGMIFVRIPAGTFIMGSTDADPETFDNEKPAHRVTITQPFYLGKYPVTQAQWEVVMDTNPNRFQGDPNLPVTDVSWQDVQAFFRTLNEREGRGDYRLPTEAQWEYACRAGTGTPRYHPDIGAIAWYKANSDARSHPVGQKLSNAWGLHDMLGNVDEWCHDGMRQYTSTNVTNPIGPTEAGAGRAIRGGGWNDPARVMRAADRYADDPANRRSNLGFRGSSAGPSQ